MLRFELSKIGHASGRIEMERLDELNNSFLRQRHEIWILTLGVALEILYSLYLAM